MATYTFELEGFGTPTDKVIVKWHSDIEFIAIRQKTVDELLKENGLGPVKETYNGYIISLPRGNHMMYRLDLSIDEINARILGLLKIKQLKELKNVKP